MSAGGNKGGDHAPAPAGDRRQLPPIQELALMAILIGTLGFGLGSMWIRRRQEQQPLEQQQQQPVEEPIMKLVYSRQPDIRDPLALICVIKGISVQYVPAVDAPNPKLIILTGDRERVITSIPLIERELIELCSAQLLNSSSADCERSSLQNLIENICTIKTMDQLFREARVNGMSQSHAYQEHMWNILQELNESSRANSTHFDEYSHLPDTLSGDNLSIADTFLNKFVYDARQVGALPDSVFQMSQYICIRAIRQHVMSFAQFIPTGPTLDMHAAN